MAKYLLIVILYPLLMFLPSTIESKQMKIKHVVIPAAGLGTRFLPATKAFPKEMLVIIDKPSLQIVVEEAIQSGITQCNIIANDDKPELYKHFSHLPKLEKHLEAKGKSELLSSINNIIDTTTFNFIPQEQPLGLGHAVLQAKDAIGDNYFGVILPDELMIGDDPALGQLIAIAEKYNASVIGVQEVPHEKVSSYGIIAIKQELENGVFEIDHLIEKPSIDEAPSNYALAGRYVLSPKIFAALENTQPGAGNEIQLTDGISHMMENGERVIAYIIKSARYDVGNPLGWIQANIEIALKHPKFGEAVKEHCKKLLS